MIKHSNCSYVKHKYKPKSLQSYNTHILEVNGMQYRALDILARFLI